ncbi:NAD-dependent epimerase/dehydratase family protein [Cyanobium sp. N.Huapi 1H5]|uniref:NAD-dependent epimerase/dehydratase family protein n=1 Tax=Cyanobium sp. N.Huapi 1H5 TaxID=2823719 RepID=UPI0020CF1045|nr:NAD-dependent epimerase/dehydratase family protein [Cyanobium sp. N.Huapi 1H5]MCP9838841.1 NAD-dependent epimerase/dehydratase family protein [Cyanobium sp. N.Huapi 1H5]
MPDPSNAALTVAVTGASGALGQALLRRWHRRGARLIALCHGCAPLELAGPDGQPIPLRQVQWQVGQEAALESLLEEVDVLVINHGINVHGDAGAAATGRSLEVNALSAWRLLELFAVVAARRGETRLDGGRRPEVWVNTSEAEIQPALSPLYEISKRLLGQLLSLRAPELAQALRLRRLVLGPFRSALNPIGVMGADWVAGQILRQADWDWGLIIVTPNPLTYVLMPLATLTRWAYYGLLRRP